MQIEMHSRLTTIRLVPLTAREIDWLTAAELYLFDMLNLPLLDFVPVCFPNIVPANLNRVQQIWEYALAAFHLTQKSHSEQDWNRKQFQMNAARIYELEMQRILGTFFPLAHPFWKVFYIRQEIEAGKPLLALDVLHNLSGHKSQIPYQLLLQSLKAILKAHYFYPDEKDTHYRTAQQLITNLPLSDFQIWISEQI